jgi:CheY-like chemotaxis protein
MRQILVVDDDRATRLAMKELLEAKGYGVACTANGQEALDHLQRSDPPFVILLDLGMPVLSGCQFRERQRRTPTLAPIPVLLLSGEHDLPQIAASLGVAGYVPKPVEFNELLAAVRVINDPTAA